MNFQYKFFYVFLLGFAYLVTGLFASTVSAHMALDSQIEHINTSLQAIPENRMLLIKRGELHRQHGDLQLALKDFLQARKLDDSSADINYYLGRLRLNMKQAEKALPLLRRFIQMNPKHANALQYQGDAYFALKQFVKAAVAYKQAAGFEKHPDPQLFLKISDSYMAANPSYPKEAKAAIEHGIIRLGPLVTLIMAGIKLELKQPNYEQALALLDSLPEVVRNSPKWLVQRGDILYKSGREEDAKLVYERVILIIEGLPSSRRNTREMSHIISALKSQQVEHNHSH